MAACGSLQHVFEKPLSENPTLLESLSPWNKIKPVKPIEQSSFTEIFGELHFKENPESSSSPSFPRSSCSSTSASFIDLIQQTETSNPNNNGSLGSEYESKKIPSLDLFSTTPKNHPYTGCYKNSDSFSPRNYESLQLCTEGLGFESFDDVEDLKNDINESWQHQEENTSIARHSTQHNQSGETRRFRLSGRAFPPPISCIGKSGVCFKSYRHGGRFVLKQVRIPSQEFLHAYREDGRLKLHLVQPSDEILEEDEVDEEEENCTEDDDQEDEETSNETDNVDDG